MQDLAEYIKKYHQKGYSVSSLKSFLQQQGYSEQDIEAGIKAAYIPENHNKWWLIGGSLLIVLIFIVSFLIFLIPSTPNLIFSSSKISDVSQGGIASFQLSVLGYDKPYSAELSYVIMLNGVIMESYSETVDVSEKRFLYSFTPLDSGIYIVTSSLNYEDVVKSSSFEMFVESSCNNGICESFETSSSCSSDCPVSVCGDDICSVGEVCESDCSIEVPVCGDNICDVDESCSIDCDICGNDVCDVGENFLSCESDCSAPVCGDNICDVGETCSADCSIKTGVNKLSRYELINHVDESFNSAGAESVARDCDSLTDLESKDLCFLELSKVSEEAFYCKFISIFTKKDDCYITYAYETDDFSVCVSLENRFKRQTCEGLEQQRELQRKYS